MSSEVIVPDDGEPVFLLQTEDWKTKKWVLKSVHESQQDTENAALTGIRAGERYRIVSVATVSIGTVQVTARLQPDEINAE